MEQVQKELKNKYSIICADFETEKCKGCEEFKHSYPRIWLAGYRELWTQKGKDFLNFIDMFYDILKNFKDTKIIIYFHNGGRFDWNYAVGELIENSYSFLHIDKSIKNISNKKRRHFQIFGGDGTIYKVKIWYQNQYVELRDSMHLMSGSIQRWGGKEYGSFGSYENKDKYIHKTLTDVNQLGEQEFLMFNSDIVTMCRVLSSKEFYGNVPDNSKTLPLTLASLAVNLLYDNKKNGLWIKLNIRDKLLVEQWDYYHCGYRGGIVYEHPKIEFNKVYKGIIRHYDISSMYPFIWSYYSLPYHSPISDKTLLKYVDKEELELPEIDKVLPDFLKNKGTGYTAYYTIYIRKAKLKDGCIPYIGVYSNCRKKPPLNDPDAALWKYLYSRHLNDVYTSYDVLIYDLEYDLWEIQLDLIKQLYDIDFEIIKTTYFRTSNYGKPFVSLLEQDKVKYDISGDEMNRNIVKLKLNGCYGKNGENRRKNQYYFEIYDKTDSIRKDARTFNIPNTNNIYVLKQREIIENDTRNLKYVPLASFTTAMASVYITYFRNKYADNFIYGDTDDLYLLNCELDEKYINNKGIFGFFKHDKKKDTFTSFCLKAPKNYCGTLLYPDINGKRQVIKTAGFTTNTDMNIYEYKKTDNFIKKMKKTANGRTYIYEKMGIITARKKKPYFYEKWKNI